MVNLHHKFDENFYDSQGDLYISDPDSYIQNEKNSIVENKIDHCMPDRKIDANTTVKIVLKVISHWLFRLIGFFQTLLNKQKFDILRKCYVEDVEALFDVECNLRLIYPFPLSAKRQLKYLRFLKSSGKTFILDGLPYDIKGFSNFIIKRTYSALNKLEARAAFRLAAIHSSKFMPVLVQCSDEYDLTSLFYCKKAQRYGIETLNSAHGIGKYLPYTGYTKFDCLSSAQIEYYSKFNPNGKFGLREMTSNVQSKVFTAVKPTFVFLGQYSGRNDYLRNDEILVLDVIKEVSLHFSSSVDFLYKPHPNNQDLSFTNLEFLQVIKGGLVSGDSKLVSQFSLFSTCQVDPNFIGHKFLIETKYIKPSISFGSNVEIVNLDCLSKYLYRRIDLVLGTHCA